ncbi:MAG: LysR family transcriptional regulator [Eubacteriales bacterium]|nr:LysR family transcriptional regulator [Eubacteriales bacterium]
MELRHLRYFYETANEMNFTRAAEKLNIAQPPLSKQIKDLEHELGVELFVRRPHFLALTPEGEMLKQYASQILSLADKAVETIREMGQGLNGTIYISTVEGHTLRALSRWISMFSKQYPSVQYNLWTGSADEIIARIRTGLCDLAILADIRDTEGLEYFKLFQENWSAIIPEEFPLSSQPGSTVKATELLPYDLIIPARPERLDEVQNWYRNNEEKPKIRCRYTNVLSAYELARQGVGIAIYPGEAESIVDPKVISTRVALKAITNPMVKANYVMLSDKNRILPHVVYEFMSFVRKQSRLDDLSTL